MIGMMPFFRTRLPTNALENATESIPRLLHCRLHDLNWFHFFRFYFFRLHFMAFIAFSDSPPNFTSSDFTSSDFTSWPSLLLMTHRKKGTEGGGSTSIHAFSLRCILGLRCILRTIHAVWMNWAGLKSEHSWKSVLNTVSALSAKLGRFPLLYVISVWVRGRVVLKASRDWCAVRPYHLSRT